jgi:hypothetical protein
VLRRSSLHGSPCGLLAPCPRSPCIAYAHVAYAHVAYAHVAYAHVAYAHVAYAHVASSFAPPTGTGSKSHLGLRSCD